MDLFPFPEVRDKQDILMENVEKSSAKRRELGCSRTNRSREDCCIAYASSRICERKRQESVFVTPRHSQHQIAIETVREMNERHEETVSSVDLIGKSHLCEAQPGLRGADGPDCPRHEATFTDSHELTEQAKARVKEFQNRSLTAGQVKMNVETYVPTRY